MQPLPQRQNALNPYGHSVSSDALTWSQEYLHAAFERARFKAASITLEPPVGPDPVYKIYAWTNLGIGLAWLGLAVISIGATGGMVGVSIWPIFLIAASSFWFQWHKKSRPDQPAHAVQAWIGALMRKKWERVDRLRVSSDRDSFLRRLPAGEGPSELPMASVHDVEQYWKEFRRRAGLHRGRWTLKKPNVRPLNNRMALVEMELSAPRLPQWLALVGLAFILLAIFGMVLVVTQTKKSPEWIAAFPLVLLVLFVVLLVAVGWRRKHQIKKVVIYNGSEWRLLSGEWQAPEDRDLRWLQ
jgi:hypothetical protein